MYFFLLLLLSPHVALAEETTYASAGCTIVSTDAHQELLCKDLNLQGRLYLTDVPIDVGKLNLAKNNLTSLDPRTITPLIRAIRGTIDLSDNPYFTSLPTDWGEETQVVLNPPESSRSYTPGIISSEKCSISQLDSDGAWCSTVNEGTLQLDLGGKCKVLGVVTQGRAGTNQWVKKYTVWTAKDQVFDPSGTEFVGNSDQNTKKTNMLPAAVTARHVRIVIAPPDNWYGHLSLRAGVLVELFEPKYILKNTRIAHAAGCLTNVGCRFEDLGCFVLSKWLSCANTLFTSGYDLHGTAFASISESFYINNVPTTGVDVLSFNNLQLATIDRRTVVGSAVKTVRFEKNLALLPFATPLFGSDTSVEQVILMGTHLAVRAGCYDTTGCPYESVGCYVSSDSEFHCGGRKFGSLGTDATSTLFLNNLPKDVTKIYLQNNEIARSFRPGMLEGFTRLTHLYLSENLAFDRLVDCAMLAGLPSTLQFYDNAKCAYCSTDAMSFEPPSTSDQNPNTRRTSVSLVNGLGIVPCELVVRSAGTGEQASDTVVELDASSLASRRQIFGTTKSVRVTRGDGLLGRLAE